MSTRGRVGLVLDDGSIQTIYCHHDSYPSYLGHVLKNHYSDTERIKKLLALGDCSVIAEKIDPPEGVAYTFNNSLEDVCVAYGRDRGEKNVSGITYPSEKEMIEDFRDSDEEYLYLFKDGRWIYMTHYGDNKFTFAELTDEAIDED